MTAFHEIQSEAYRQRCAIVTETRQLTKNDIRYLRYIKQNGTNLPPSLIEVFGHMIEYNRCRRTCAEIMAAHKDPSESLIHMRIKILMKQEGGVKKVIEIIKSVEDEKQKIELLDSFGVEILKFGYFDEMIELLNSLKERPERKGPCTRQTLAQHLVSAGECMISLKLIDTTSDLEQKNMMLMQAISTTFKERKGDYKKFIKTLLERGHLNTCLSIALEKEQSFLYDIADVLIELRDYERALEVRCTYIGKTTFQELSAELLKKRKYDHAINVLENIPDHEMRKSALEELGNKFREFGMTELAERAELCVCYS